MPMNKIYWIELNMVLILLAELVPDEVQNELRHHYSALCELLRHFWSCFPVTSKFLEEKVCFIKPWTERFKVTGPVVWSRET